MDQLFTTPFMPFTVAILVMFGIGLIEALGLGLSAFDLDAPGVDGKDGGALSWLGVGEVPLLMLLIVFLTLFGLGGLILQNSLLEMTGTTLSLFIAIPLVVVGTLPLMGVSARFMARIMPKDETTAVDLDSLRGLRATICLGTASVGNPNRAVVRDHYGQFHYLMVEPDVGTVSEGDELILVRREGNVFVGTAPYSSDLKSI